MPKTTVVWFRHDLRLADHPALTAACARGRVVPLFVWSPEREEPWAPGGAHRWWLHGHLPSLDADLREKGSRLVLRAGDPLEQIRAVLRETGADAVYWNRRYAPNLTALSNPVADALAADGIEVKRFASALLHDPSAIRTGSGTPYRVFTPYWRKVRATLQVDEPLPVPRMGTSKAPASWPDSASLDSLSLSDVQQDGVSWAGQMAERWERSEKGAHDRLDRFLDQSLLDYPEARDVPDRRDTSELSPYLHHGAVTPRQIWYRTGAWVQNGAMREAADKFLSEVGWREFSYHVLIHHPETPTEPLKEKYAHLHWRADDDAFERWKRGQTGYPLVDAGMRQLWALGWMHNRLRLVTASFLTKDLLLPWQRGARYFWDTLVGGDLANNTMGWQWAAGSGADAQPFFRIFNPVGQSKKHDPSGAFIRAWVPEIAALPDRCVHAPWTAPPEVLGEAGVELGRTYPRPIVDHAEARDRALAALRAINDEA